MRRAVGLESRLRSRCARCDSSRPCFPFREPPYSVRSFISHRNFSYMASIPGRRIIHGPGNIHWTLRLRNSQQATIKVFHLKSHGAFRPASTNVFARLDVAGGRQSYPCTVHSEYVLYMPRDEDSGDVVSGEKGVSRSSAAKFCSMAMQQLRYTLSILLVMSQILNVNLTLSLSICKCSLNPLPDNSGW